MVTLRDFLKFLSTLRQALTALFPESSESDTVLEMGGRRERGENRKGDREGEQIGRGRGEGRRHIAFAFHLSRALTSAWIRQRVYSHRSVLLFRGGEERSYTSWPSRSADAFR